MIPNGTKTTIQCPECAERWHETRPSGILIVRTTRETQEQFLGCSNFFDGCYYTQEISESLRKVLQEKSR